MKRTIKITLFALGLIAFVGLPGFVPDFPSLAGLQAVAQAATENILNLDYACDCRTGAGGVNPGGPFVINGKIFPAGTLPSGTASNDPTVPVNGVAPIGNWTCRGQYSANFPPAIAPAYSAISFAYNTQYFILNDGRALTVEGYTLRPSGERLSVTGGIGGFRGASGDVEEQVIGTNATGCPNVRVKITLVS